MRAGSAELSLFFSSFSNRPLVLATPLRTERERERERERNRERDEKLF